MNKTINVQTVITCLNLMYPGKFVEVSVHFASHTSVNGINKPMQTVWELFVKDHYCKEFNSLHDLFVFIQNEYSNLKLEKAL